MTRTITHLPSEPNLQNHDVFISYSRRDQAFVRNLDAEFRKLNRSPWVDWDSIRKGEEWWAAIQHGIEGANTFVFVISPDSINSLVCQDEINYAALNNKRFLPIVHREGFDPGRVHPEISSHNWLFFRETDDFQSSFQELLKAIDTDLEYVRMHTRLLVRAIEWQEKFKDSSYLLRGSDLEAAEQWVINSKKPPATHLQVQYIRSSRDAETARRSAISRSRRNVVAFTIFANLLVSSLAGIWFYKVRINEATDRIREDLVSALRIGIIGTNGDRFPEVAAIRVAQGENPKNNPLYQEQQQWLLNVNTVFPNAFPRTFIAGKPGEILWVGDVTREVRKTRKETRFLDSYSAEHKELDVFKNQETVVMNPYQDELGQWISASAPIKNSRGDIVGGMRVDFTQTYLESVQKSVQRDLMIAYIVVLAWLLTLSWIILRSMRSIRDR
ncbi:toll/interleukin-1 receptor domain-containing protein [Leptolyngbya sp. AN10]|uniref:toll/interleukin-1 receptor domain-containing protein n=1 Tax=Leptolyngbya sp. AN10 TaxID=3423365 RepID=UPI003D317C05